MAKTSSTSSTHKRQISKQLVKTVKKAAAASHAPYSHINVGAVLYAASGTMFAGTNIESCSYSLTMCAERVALFETADLYVVITEALPNSLRGRLDVGNRAGQQRPHTVVSEVL